MENKSAFYNLKHSKWLSMLVKSMFSPVSIPLADAMLEEKKRQYEEVMALREIAARHQARRAAQQSVRGESNG